MQCAHANARLRGIQTKDFVSAVCDDCEESWMGPSYDWESRRGAVHKVPEWVKRLLDPPRRNEKPA
jgi:hypothetical protein